MNLQDKMKVMKTSLGFCNFNHVDRGKSSRLTFYKVYVSLQAAAVLYNLCPFKHLNLFFQPPGGITSDGISFLT